MNAASSVIVLLLFICQQAAAKILEWRGVDVSGLEQVEDAVDKIDVSFWYEGENTRSVAEILAESEVNVARLRLLHSPEDGVNGLDYTLKLAKKLTRAGIDGIMLNIFYSDEWTNPKQQTTPKAWQSLSFNDLGNSVEQYTNDVLRKFIDEGIKITAVQLGNEIERGILWPEGMVNGRELEWRKLGALLHSAQMGVKKAFSNQDAPKIVLHLAKGAQRNVSQWFFKGLVSHFNDFQVIGVSYFPWLMKTESIDDLGSTLKGLASDYNKLVAVVETAYPWTLKWDDNTPNAVGLKSQLLDGFPATEAGQRHFLSMLRDTLEGLSGDSGIGMIYKDPEWIPTWNVLGSWWENLALFNFYGEALRGLEIFSRGTSPPKKDANMDIVWHGADASYLSFVEDSGGKFREPVPETFQKNGINIVRLRLFHTPIWENGASSLEYTLALAKRFHDKGMGILLAIHYSDTWADPEFQRKPKAWEGLGVRELAEHVEEYTTMVLTKFIDEGVPLAAVQLGNEITTGMLYPEGRVGDDEHSPTSQYSEQVYNTPEQWAQFRTLIRAAIKGAKAVKQDSPLKLILHHSRSGDNAACRWFFDLLLKDGNIDFDIIGVSYYNWWDGNGPISKFKANVNDLAKRYEKDVLLLETAYPWTLDESINDGLENIVEFDYQLLPHYEATKEGQWNYLLTLRNIMAEIPNNRGLGMLYWEPSWIVAPRGPGCRWENLALYDENGDALPAFAALGDSVRFP